MGENTIYDYYEKISERYFIARTFNDPKVIYFWQPLARTVSIRDYEDFDFFIYKEGKCLMLAEGLTGAVILRQCDFQSRIMRRCKVKLFRDCLPAELAKKGGRGMVNKTIVNWILDNNTFSPRYKPIKV